MTADKVEDPARLRDVFIFEYSQAPEQNCVLLVVRMDGDGPNDFVFFNDGSHSKQKNLKGVERRRVES